MTTTMKDIKAGKIPEGEVIYRAKPYVMLSKENIVLGSGTLEELKKVGETSGDYYDDCRVEVREYDFYLNDNTKIKKAKDPKMAEEEALRDELVRTMKEHGWRVRVGPDSGIAMIYARKGANVIDVLCSGRIEVGRTLEDGRFAVILVQNNPSRLAGIKSALQFDYSYSIS